MITNQFLSMQTGITNTSNIEEYHEHGYQRKDDRYLEKSPCSIDSLRLRDQRCVSNLRIVENLLFYRWLSNLFLDASSWNKLSQSSSEKNIKKIPWGPNVKDHPQVVPSESDNLHICLQGWLFCCISAQRLCWIVFNLWLWMCCQPTKINS